MQDVRIWSIQDRTSWKSPRRRPYVVRWVVDGHRFSRGHETRARADRYRSRLMTAAHDGERFDVRRGEPVSWAPSVEETPVHAWARTWVGQEWDGWAPRSRASVVESLERFVPLAVDAQAPPPPPGMRAHLHATLRPGSVIDPDSPEERWLARWGLTLSQLDSARLAEVERRLGVGDAGQPLAASTAGRFRKNAHACVSRAVALGLLQVDPWPPRPRGRSRRKSERKRQVVDVRRLPDPEGMADIIRAIRSHQPGSRNYQAMTAVSYYAGLRPSEVVMLRPRALWLPEDGWGAVDVVEADVDWDEPGEPKTGPRRVPIPPELVAMLGAWVAEHGITAAGLLFRTRNGNRPAPSNWTRALKRACQAVGRVPIHPYAVRHACATAWLRAGVPLGEVAAWLGHSVETLVTVYVGALEGDDSLARARVDAAAGSSRAWMLDQTGSAVPRPYRADRPTAGVSGQQRQNGLRP